jgi:hypothetical protein
LIKGEPSVNIRCREPSPMNLTMALAALTRARSCPDGISRGGRAIRWHLGNNSTIVLFRPPTSPGTFELVRGSASLASYLQ